jgi:hypothetical protein
MREFSKAVDREQGIMDRKQGKRDKKRRQETRAESVRLVPEKKDPGNDKTQDCREKDGKEINIRHTTRT